MARFVEAYFKPEMLGAREHSLKPISQYVLGGRETLLLEPINLDTDLFEQELQEVHGTLCAWESLTRRFKKANLNFSVYVFGTSKTNMDLLGDTLSESGVTIVDTNLRSEREQLVTTIHALSEQRAALHS